MSKERAIRDTSPLLCYVYVWGNNAKRKTLKGRVCKIVKRGAKRSALIEFSDNGQRELVDFYALRKHNAELTGSNEKDAK